MTNIITIVAAVEDAPATTYPSSALSGPAVLDFGSPYDSESIIRFNVNGTIDKIEQDDGTPVTTKIGDWIFPLGRQDATRHKVEYTGLTGTALDTGGASDTPLLISTARSYGYISTTSGSDSCSLTFRILDGDDSDAELSSRTSTINLDNS